MTTDAARRARAAAAAAPSGGGGGSSVSLLAFALFAIVLGLTSTAHASLIPKVEEAIESGNFTTADALERSIFGDVNNNFDVVTRPSAGADDNFNVATRPRADGECLHSSTFHLNLSRFVGFCNINPTQRITPTVLRSS